MHWIVLHNPEAKGGRRVLRAAKPLIDARPTPELRYVSLRELGDAARSDSDRQEIGRLLVVGGDGSINCAAEWLRKRELSIPLGIIPGGTGNNLARGLGLPLETEAAVRVATGKGPVRSIDSIRYRGRDGEAKLFVQTGALGFPADVAERYDRLRRRSLWRTLFRPFGPHVYRTLALLGLRGQRQRERRGERLLEVELRLPNGECLKETVLAIFLGNERSLGGNFVPCPKAELDDGQLDICMVRAGIRVPYLKTFQRVGRGEHLDMTEAVVYRQSEGPLELALSEEAGLLADGDLWVRSDSFRFEVLPKSVEVMVE